MSSTYRIILSDEGPTLETLDYTIHIGSTPTFLYFDLYRISFCLNMKPVFNSSQVLKQDSVVRRVTFQNVGPSPRQTGSRL